jgi:hypothetical protein
VEVNDFMLDRARKYPLCAFALLEMRLVTVAKLMRNAKSKGNKGGAVDDFFFTAIKLALPLYALTQKTDYVYLCQELLKQYYCALPAQRMFYSHYIFTRKASKVLSIFRDFLI